MDKVIAGGSSPKAVFQEKQKSLDENLLKRKLRKVETHGSIFGSSGIIDQDELQKSMRAKNNVVSIDELFNTMVKSPKESEKKTYWEKMNYKKEVKRKRILTQLSLGPGVKMERNDAFAIGNASEVGNRNNESAY